MGNLVFHAVLRCAPAVESGAEVRSWGSEYVPQHFACLQSSTVGSSNEEGLLDKERPMLQLESWQVCTEGIRVRRCGGRALRALQLCFARGEKWTVEIAEQRDVHTHIVPRM